MKVLGFDYGLTRIGVALGNTETLMATPLCAFNRKNQQPPWDAIEALIQEWGVDRLVVGQPLYNDGNKSDFTEQAEKFARQLSGRFSLEVDLVSEQLSSLEAEQRLKSSRQAGRKKPIKKEEIDKLAAAIIVESWLARRPL